MISPIKRIIENIKTKREEKKTIEQYLRACEIFDKLKDSYGYVSVETCLWAFKENGAEIPIPLGVGMNATNKV